MIINILWYIICGFIIIEIFINSTKYKKYIDIVIKNIKILFFYFFKNKTINSSDKIKEIKNKFNIKSTENTIKLNNLVINKPNNIEINNITNNVNFKYTNKLTIISKEYTFSNKIIDSYIYNKKIFNNIFIDNNEKYKIYSLESFYVFYKNNIDNKLKFNILLKFYLNKKPDEYKYILVKKNNLIKINNDIDYNKICDNICIKNNTLLLKNINNDHYILHGEYIDKSINNNQIKKIFFVNKNENDNNYKILKKYDNIKIFFFTCTKINL